MPRKPPSQVIEHRLSLSDFERRELKQVIDSYQKNKALENAPKLMLGGAAVGAVALAAYVAYKLYDIVPNPFDLTDEEKSAVKWVFSLGGVLGDVEKKEWRTFGVPQKAGDIETMYNLNVARLNELLEKANSSIAYFQQVSGFKVPIWLMKANEKAVAYRDVGHAESMQHLEEWKAYYIEKLADSQ